MGVLRPYLRQVLCTGIACYVCMTLGITYAWPSCTLSLFTSNETVLHRAMTETELSLFGSLSSIGALISTPIVGCLLDVVGRKYCAIAAILMQVICWTMITASTRVEVILTAIFISGLGGASVLVVPIIVVEICQENIRGTMTSGYMVFYAIGMLISYVAGGMLDYKTMTYVCLTLAVIGSMLLTMLRETPMFYMNKGMEEEAAQSFAFYRSAKVGSKVVMNEMEKLRRAFNPQLDEDNLQPEEHKLNWEKSADFQLQPSKEKLSLWKFIRKSRSTRRAMFVTITLITASICQGLAVVQVYAAPLFKEAVPNLSATVACVIFSLITIVSGLIAAYLTDVAGRKYLMIYSSVAAGLCCIGLGSQLHLHWGPHWVTAIFIYLFTASYTFGAGTVPFVLVAEVFLPEVKSFMSMFVIEWAWVCNFIILFIFNPLVSAIGLGPIFYLFAGICMVTALFSMVFQPETKGLPVDAIQMLFLRRSVN